MAVVKITDRLVDRTMSNARDKVRNLVERAEKSYPEDLAMRIYNKGMAPYIEHVNKLPVEFFNVTDNFRVYIEGSVTVSAEPTLQKKRFSVEIPAFNGTKLLLPSAFPSGHMLTRKYWGVGLNLDHSDAHEFHPEIEAYALRIVDAGSKADAFVNGVKAVLRKYSTLAPALKEWPALWELLPADVREQHRKVVERVKRDKPAKSGGDDASSIDLNALTSVVVAAKMQGN